MESTSLEGFICPECLKTLSSVGHLEAHFNSKHLKIPRQSRDREQHNAINPVLDLTNSLAIYDSEFWNQNTDSHNKLVIRNHTDAFKKIRANFVGPKAIESNKTLLRLEKILAVENPNNIDGRKDYEKSVVSWARDEDVPLCPSCGKTFSMVLLRRKHHCRLCGAIMCQSCSRLVSFTFASALIKSFLQKTVSSTKDGEDFLRLFTAYNSFEVLSQQCSTEDEPQIKICLYCVSILMRVTQEVTKRLSNSGTEILYKQLYRKMEEVHEMRPKFLHAATCLSKGESDYTFGEATEMRHNLLKSYEVIEGLSKRIVSGCSSSPQEYKLAIAIRKHSQLFLQQNLYALQSLPTQEQYLMQKENRKTAVLRKLEQDKLEAAYLGSGTPTRSTPSSSPDRSTRPSKRANGFLPAASVSGAVGASEGEDPVLLQIRQVQGYLTQARNAGRNDEVQMLTENLRQLQTLLNPKSLPS